MKFPNWLITVSMFVSERTGGPKGWTLCARLWDARLKGSRAAKAACYVTDTLFFFDPQHCRRSWLLRSG